MSFSDPARQMIWIIRLLFLAPFLTLLISFNLWFLPFAIPYLGAIILLSCTGVSIAIEEEAFEQLNDEYLEDISGFHTRENVSVIPLNEQIRPSDEQ